MTIERRFPAFSRAKWAEALVALIACACLSACAGESGNVTTRAGDAPRSSNEQRTERGGNPGTSSEISHGNGRGGDHHSMRHR